ncbi:MAG: hypothetical protein H7834_16520 [Magnetococcus sp. YQC-9]
MDTQEHLNLVESAMKIASVALAFQGVNDIPVAQIPKGTSCIPWSTCSISPDRSGLM